MLSPAWFLDKVEIMDNHDREKYIFHCERWLGKGKDDGKIDRTIYVKVRFPTKACILFYGSHAGLHKKHEKTSETAR